MIKRIFLLLVALFNIIGVVNVAYATEGVINQSGYTITELTLPSVAPAPEQGEATYVVAGAVDGEAMFFGDPWNGVSEANRLTLNEDIGLYEKTYEDIEFDEAATIEYKIVKDGSVWIPSGDNLTCIISEAGIYTITVSFNADPLKASMIAVKEEEPIESIWAEINGIHYKLDPNANTAEVISWYDNDTRYSGDMEIPKSVEYNDEIYNVTSIGSYAFWQCKRVTSITIPNSVTTIGESAFSYCDQLRSVTIPNSVTSIGEQAFHYCIKMTSLTIPGSVTSIGNSAFSYSGLTSIDIPNSVTSIGESAFAYCMSLKSVTIGSGITSIGEKVFFYCVYLSSVTIPSNVTSIGKSAFSYSGLTSIDIPNSVTSIGESAFSNCMSLNSVTIGSGITSIKKGTFGNCRALTTVIIGENVNEIGVQSFADCNLSDVYCYAENVPNTEEDAFDGSFRYSPTLHVHRTAINDYKATIPWNSFNEIVSIEPPEKCATPVICFINGKIELSCETEGVEYVTKITSADQNKHNTSTIKLTGTYTVSVYAKKEEYDNSDVATMEIKLPGIEASGFLGDLNNDDKVDAADAVTLSNIIIGKK